MSKGLVQKGHHLICLIQESCFKLKTSFRYSTHDQLQAGSEARLNQFGERNGNKVVFSFFSYTLLSKFFNLILPSNKERFYFTKLTL
jgi:hypothetical protein